VQPEDCRQEASDSRSAGSGAARAQLEDVVTSRCGTVALTVGEQPAAMSISWAEPVGPIDSGFIVFFSEFDPDADDNETPTLTVCLHCLVEDGDAQLGRGLDLGTQHGEVDYDPGTDAWFIPDA
jgi:hypothetical protein